MLNKALNIAYKAHIGQLDKGGSPYILHPVRVALHCQTEDEKIVALLHDVVEDTSITFEDLKTEGLDDRLLEALKCLIKEEGEDYKAFIQSHKTDDLRMLFHLSGYECHFVSRGFHMLYDSYSAIHDCRDYNKFYHERKHYDISYKNTVSQ